MVHTDGAGDDDDRPSHSSGAVLAIAAAGSGAGTPTSVSTRRLYHQQSQQQFLQQQHQQQLSPQPQERHSNRSSRNASGSSIRAAVMSNPPLLATNTVAPAPSNPGTPTAALSAAASPSQVGVSASRRLYQQTFGDSARGSSPATPHSNMTTAGTPAGFSRPASRDVISEPPGGSGGTAGGSVGSAVVAEDVLPLSPEGGVAGGSSGGVGQSSGRGAAAALRTATNMRGPSRLGTNYCSPPPVALVAGAVQWPTLAIDEAAGGGTGGPAGGIGVAVTSPGEVVHESDLLPGAAAVAPPPALPSPMSPGSKQHSISGQHSASGQHPAASAASMLNSTTMTTSMRAALGAAAQPPLGRSPHLGAAPDTGPASAPARAAAAASHPAANSPHAAATTASGASPAAGHAADGPQARRASMLSIESEFNALREQFSNQSRWLLEQLAGGPEPPSGPPRGMPPLPELGDDDCMPLPVSAAPRAMPRRGMTLSSAAAAAAAAAAAGGVRLGGVGTHVAGAGAGGMKGGTSASGGLESGPAGAGAGFVTAAAAGKSLRRQTSDAPNRHLHGAAYTQLQSMWQEQKAAQQLGQPPLQAAPPLQDAHRASEPNGPVSYRSLLLAAGSGTGSYRQLQPQPPQHPRPLQAGGQSPVPRPVQLSWSASGETAPRVSPTGGGVGSGATSFAGAVQGRSPGGTSGMGGAGAVVSPSKASGPTRLSPGGSGLPPRPPAV